MLFKVQERSHVSFKNGNIAIFMVLCMQWVAGVMLLDIDPVLNAFVCLTDAFVLKYQE
jgi:hypothetical protein